MSENKDDVAEPMKLESVLQVKEDVQEIRVESFVCGGYTPEERAIVKGGDVDTLLQGLRAQIESSVASDGSVFEPMTYTVRRRSVATAHKRRRRRRRPTTNTRYSLLHCNPTHVTIDGLPPTVSPHLLLSPPVPGRGWNELPLQGQDRRWDRERIGVQITRRCGQSKRVFPRLGKNGLSSRSVKSCAWLGTKNQRAPFLK